MKKFRVKLGIIVGKIVGIMLILGIFVWMTLCIPMLAITTAITIAIQDFDDQSESECKRNEIAETLRARALDLLVLPYKWLGIANDYNEFVSWVIFN